MSWKYIFSTVTGGSHQRTALPCQDASECSILTLSSGEQILIAVASDGAGSAERSQIGSSLACELFTNEIKTHFEIGGSLPAITEEFCHKWLLRFQREIGLRAEAEEMSTRDFACTLIAAVVGSGSAVFLQIGDGAIVISPPEEPGNYCWQFWPDKGEYANQTYFATEPNAQVNLQYAYSPIRTDEIAIFTDGLERLALHMATQTAHAGFFRPMFAPLRTAQEEYPPTLNVALENFLLSKRVQDQADDDLTLILATRRAVPDVPAEAN